MPKITFKESKNLRDTAPKEYFKAFSDLLKQKEYKKQLFEKRKLPSEAKIFELMSERMSITPITVRRIIIEISCVNRIKS